MKYSSDKDVNHMVLGLVREGWGFVCGKKHNRLISPFNGKALIFSKSPSDFRAIRNMKRDIKKLNETH
ncbi:MAG: hypothetical protein K6L60_12005 [Oceanobacter sp.]